ncbi:MAG: hypothetical protein ABSG93_10490 [Solirubrobacteraceae bacterium]|jgi:hypothetical protein
MTRVRLRRALPPAALVSSAALLLGASGACGGTLTSRRPTSTASDAVQAAPASAACTTGKRSVCITRSDDNRTVTVGVGWTVDVQLRSPGLTWSVPTEPGSHLLRQVGAARRDGGAAQVAYTAIASGHTELRALERPLCAAGRACPQFIVLWQVRIHVTGH